MKTLPVVLIVLSLAAPALATVINPDFLPGLSASDAAPGSPPGRLVDNSGMTPPVHSGTSLVETLAAEHVINGASVDSWETNDPPPLGGDYYTDAPAPPVLVFDLSRDREIAALYFWQLQRDVGAANCAQTIEVRFAPDPGGGPPVFPISPDVTATLDAQPLPLPQAPNGVQQVAVPGLPVARFVKLTVTDNHGGARVGLGEFRVGTADHPMVELPAEVDVSGDLEPRQIVVNLLNSGQPGSTFSLQSITFSDPSQFQIDPASGFTLPQDVSGGANLPIPILFTPDGIGTDQELITLGIDPVPGPGSGAVEDYSLSAGGSSIPDPWLYAEPLDLGSFPKGAGPQSFSFMISNYGETQTLQVSSATDTEADGDHFSYDFSSSTGISVPSLDSSSLAGSFDPGTETGTLESLLHFTSNSQDAGEHEVTVSATILDDLEITSPPVVTIEPLAMDETSDITISLRNTGPENDYGFSAPPELTGDSSLSLISYPPGEIGQEGDSAESRQIKIRFMHDGEPGLYPLTVTVSLSSGGVSLGEFQLQMLVKIRSVLEWEPLGFNGSGVFSIRLGNALDGEELHMRASTDLMDWTPVPSSVADPNITGTGNDQTVELTIDRGERPRYFLRVFEGHVSVP